MGLVRSLIVALAAALALPGCCSLFCRVEAPAGPAPFTRDAPEESVDFLIDAFENRRIADIYNSIHPDLRQRFGGFSQGDFTAAFQEFEHLFLEDARRFQQATRTFRGFDRKTGTVAGVELVDGDMSVLVLFKNRPVARVTLDDDFVPESTAVIPQLHEILQLDGGVLMPTIPVEFDGLSGADPRTIKRLEYHSDWLFYDYSNARNVRFIERLEQEFSN